MLHYDDVRGNFLRPPHSTTPLKRAMIGAEGQNYNHGGNFGLLIRPILVWFVIYKLTQNFLSSIKTISLKEKSLKIDFEDGSPGSHHGFPIETI